MEGRQPHVEVSCRMQPLRKGRQGYQLVEGEYSRYSVRGRHQPHREVSCCKGRQNIAAPPHLPMHCN